MRKGTKKTQTLTKAQRLVMLNRWQRDGKLENKSYTQIANMFPEPPNRSTIMRDLLDLNELRMMFKDI